MEILRSIVYVSSATHQMSPSELEQLLQASRKSNAQSAITGMLLYCDGNFMQMLEGPRQSLDDVMARIRASALHSDVTVLVDEAVSVREFESWSMAFQRAQAQEFLAMRRARWVRDDDQLTQGREMLREFWRNSRQAA